MRALLIVNPKATATHERARDVLAAALASDLKLDVATTERRGHAAELGAQAVADGLEVVVALGGDGTVNEVVNGLLSEGPGEHVPALAVVPGGSTNVFARALGLPRSAVDATADILGALRAGRSRTIGLGKADDRWFTFSSELGFGADVVAAVERRRAHGRRATPSLFIRTAVERFFLGADRRNPHLTLTVPGEEPVPGLFLGIVSNTAPWTYLRGRPVDVNPDARFELGLDLLALRRLRTVSTLRHVRQALASRPNPRGRAVLRRHDLAELTLTADEPVGFEVDGDYLGTRESVTYRSVPDALRVVL